MSEECRECNAIREQSRLFAMAGRCYKHGIVTVDCFVPSAEERAVIMAIGGELELSFDQVVRQAVRSYQIEHEKRMGRY